MFALADRNSRHEFPNRVCCLLLTTASFSQSNPKFCNLLQVATLTGFDLDGDNLTWSATDGNGNGTVTFSTTNALATSTVSVFYQVNSNFVGNTTVTIALSDDNNASTTLDININVLGVDFTLATNTINLIENASNTIRYELGIK